MENPVIDICKKVEAMLLLEENKKESTNKPKKKSKGFVVRNISDDTQPFNKGGHFSDALSKEKINNIYQVRFDTRFTPDGKKVFMIKKQEKYMKYQKM